MLREEEFFLGCRHILMFGSDIHTINSEMVKSWLDANKLTKDDIDGIRLSDSVMAITNGSFSDFENLACVHLGKNIRSIGDKAFFNCSNLKFINDDFSKVSAIPRSVWQIGDFAFSGCGIEKWKNNKLSVTDLGRGIFEHSKMGTSVQLKNQCEIPEYMYSRCNLKTVDLSKEITTIRDYAFKDTIIEMLHFVEPYSLKIEDKAFSGAMIKVVFIDSMTLVIKNTDVLKADSLAIYEGSAMEEFLKNLHKSDILKRVTLIRSG